ncbi:MAG: YraN family protein [Proteobacteria bacterium]|nr:YraN family protein [Pseudomonadota bacterium]
MDLKRIELGKMGEKEAEKLLKRAGYKVVERNFRCKYGEIDIIALDGGVLVFIEVKTRTTSDFGSGKEAVNRRKQTKIVKSSLAYINEKWQGAEPQCRFDVVSIECVEGRAGKFKSEVIKDAFSADGLI